MTTSEPSRLDRIEQILDRLAARSEITDQQIASNARAIEANSNAIAETRQTLAEMGERLNDSVQDLTQMLIPHQHLDETLPSQICCHAKVVFFTPIHSSDSPHKPKDLAPLKAVHATLSG